jgi:hypothetical protein
MTVTQRDAFSFVVVEPARAPIKSKAFCELAAMLTSNALTRKATGKQLRTAPEVHPDSQRCKRMHLSIKAQLQAV